MRVSNSLLFYGEERHDDRDNDIPLRELEHLSATEFAFLPACLAGVTRAVPVLSDVFGLIGPDQLLLRSATASLI